MDPLTRGDPTSPLRWTCKSRGKLAAALTEQGWRVSSTTVGRLGYRLQSPRKRQEGATHPDRNAQFEHINQTADEHLAAGQPVISVDTKKKELAGGSKSCINRPDIELQPVRQTRENGPLPNWEVAI